MMPYKSMRETSTAMPDSIFYIAWDGVGNRYLPQH